MAHVFNRRKAGHLNQYYRGGADEEQALVDNRLAFKKYSARVRVERRCNSLANNRRICRGYTERGSTNALLNCITVAATVIMLL